MEGLLPLKFLTPLFSFIPSGKNRTVLKCVFSRMSSYIHKEGTPRVIMGGSSFLPIYVCICPTGRCLSPYSRWLSLHPDFDFPIMLTHRKVSCRIQAISIEDCCKTEKFFSPVIKKNLDPCLKIFLSWLFMLGNLTTISCADMLP